MIEINSLQFELKGAENNFKLVSLVFLHGLQTKFPTDYCSLMK